MTTTRTAGRRWRLSAHGVVLGLVTCSACGGDSGRVATGAAAHDSAGVRIIEAGRPSDLAWSVVEPPRFVVGWGADDPAFYWVQSGRILPDRGAAIGEFGSGSVLRLSRSGEVVGTVGRKGEGPGEFQGLDGMVLDGASVVVSDGRLGRVTRLPLEGDSIATSPLSGGFLHSVSSVLPDGRALLVPGTGYGGVNEVRPEWVFESQPILAGDLVTGSLDTLAVLPHLRRWYGTRGGSPGAVPVRGLAAGTPEGFAWARADRPEVRWYDVSGALTRIVRWTEEAPPFDADFREGYLRGFEEALRENGTDDENLRVRMSDFEEQLDRYEGPLPYWNEFHVDGAGAVWLQEFAPSWAPTHRWRVVTPAGEVGWVELPGLVSVLDISEDRVLGVRMDALDVSAVVMLDLIGR